MDLALYHETLGYYRRKRDPFGASGDFYTAEQLQPVFGRLIARCLRRFAKHFQTTRVTVVEMGAGRRELAPAFPEFYYIPVEKGAGELPRSFEGIVFSNEFFDAIPVDLIVRRGGNWFYRRVGILDGRFIWDDTQPAGTPSDTEAEVLELSTHRTSELRGIAERLQRGFIFTVDYGYTKRELMRFPQGTLMSYRRHLAIDDVLLAPGDQDITAHVDFSSLQHEGQRMGLKTEIFESLASVLLRAGEPDAFASALAGEDEAAIARHRMQLKSLLFGMGETFRVLVQSKGMGSQ